MMDIDSARNINNENQSYPQWDMSHLKTHLQAMVDLEFWTIPYYFSALYSIKDRTNPAFLAILSVVNEEMFHVQLAANIANAFGLSPTFNAPVYQGKAIPHLDFNYDTPDPTTLYSPYSAELGPLDKTRINTMCLIEYPLWQTGQGQDRREIVSEYGSIGALYQSVRYGARLLSEHIVGNRHQVDMFKNYFNHFENQTVTKNGDQGLKQVNKLMDAIVEQGEGKTEGAATIPKEFQNTARSNDADKDHFTKFLSILNAPKLPKVYEGDPHPPQGSPGYNAQQQLINAFDELRSSMENLFSGGESASFGRTMSAIGGYISNCWQQGAVPKFSRDG